MKKLIALIHFIEMKKLIALILFPFLVIPFGAKANDNFSVEIEALTLVMEQYKEETESSV